MAGHFDAPLGRRSANVTGCDRRGADLLGDLDLRVAGDQRASGQRQEEDREGDQVRDGTGLVGEAPVLQA